MHRVLIAATPGPLADAATAAFAALGEGVGVARDVQGVLGACRQPELDVIVVVEGITEDLAGLCRELRTLASSKASVVALVTAPTGAELLRELEGPLDDVIWLPAQPGEIQARCAARLNQRRSRVPLAGEERHARAIRLVAHDLNNPLTAIRILAEMLVGEFEDQELRRDMGDMLEAADLCSAIIESMSALMRLQSPDDEMTWFPVEFTDVVRQVAARPSYRNHVRLSVPEDPCRVRGNRGSLVQAVSDVLLNARRLCDNRGRVDLTLTSTPRWVTLVASHAAMKVPPASRDKLLELYGSVELRAQRVPVAAAGLAFASSVADRHGGELEIRDEAEGTASLVFRISR